MSGPGTSDIVFARSLRRRSFLLRKLRCRSAFHALVSTLQDTQGIAIKRQLGEQQVKLYDWSRTAAKTLNVYRALLLG